MVRGLKETQSIEVDDALAINAIPYVSECIPDRSCIVRHERVVDQDLSVAVAPV